MVHILAAERRRKILELLEREGSVSVADLSSRFGISEVTIRQDLRRLERQGLLCRTYGGALSRTAAGFESTVAERIRIAAHEKRLIAAYAASMVREGDVVLLNDGTTTLEIVRQVPEHLRFTIVTNNWNIIAEFGSHHDRSLIVLGGTLRPGSMALVGPLTIANLRRLRADKLFLGVDGISVAHGISSPNMLEAEVNRAMIESARLVTVVADHTKFGRECLYQIASLQEIDVIICDAGAPRAILENITALGVEVHTVGESTDEDTAAADAGREEGKTG